ncbi:unnamed protein product [Paramecium octaurelia]|uniref:Uncharacterized protein n=1 Tax=Paramecium octaurelia TaxID=43137 RepID=A0A8S1UBR6_PAROT|nr:unnamed protein product [Paramecium octaurelia]
MKIQKIFYNSYVELKYVEEYELQDQKDYHISTYLKVLEFNWIIRSKKLLKNQYQKVGALTICIYPIVRSKFR